jgi:hypothetical protein
METIKEFKDLGQTVATRGVTNLISKSPEYSKWVQKCVQRYMLCDWGDLGPEDKALNDESINPDEPERVLARYNHKEGDIYIITEWDRSITTILFPSEY